MTIVQQIRQLLSNLFQWWVTIAPWQQGIRVRLGKHTKLLVPGVHLRIPLIDMIYMQPIRLRAHYVEAQTLTTTDGKTLTIAGSMQYQIVDLLQLYSTLHNAHDTVGQLFEGALATYVFGRSSSDLKPAECEQHMLESLDLSRFGLELRQVKINNFAFSRTYRLISGEIRNWTGYDQRLETNRAMGEAPPQ